MIEFPEDTTPTSAALACVAELLAAAMERAWDRVMLRKALLILVCRIAAEGEPDDAAILEEVRLVLAQHRRADAPQH